MISQSVFHHPDHHLVSQVVSLRLVVRIEFTLNAVEFLFCRGSINASRIAASILCRAPPDACTVAQPDDHPRDRPREGYAQQDREQRLHGTALEDTGTCRMLLNMPI